MSQNLGKLLTVAVVVAMCSAAPVHAQTCEDFDECTNPDMCADGDCIGTPISGGSCDDGNACTGNDTCAAGACVGTPLDGGTCDDSNECTTNDTCVSGTCQGAAVESGTICGVSECGLCMSGLCAPNPGRQGQPCTDPIGACTTNDICLGTLCLGNFMNCPDSDDDACTRDVCNPATGECVNTGPIVCGQCSACDPESGQCNAADEGDACDDLDVCTANTTCQGGACLGIPSGSATATVTPSGGTQLTATATPTGVPTGTGTATVTATATTGGVGTPTFTPTEGLATPTGTPTGTAAATATGTPTGTAAATATATATATGTPTGTAAATATATSTVGGPTATATATVSAATSTATVTRTATPTNTPLPINASIIVGSATGQPGSTVTVSVSLETTVEVAGTQNDITFDPKARIAANGEGNPNCTVNPAISKPGSTFAFQPVDCTPGTDCTGVRALILALDNVTPIPDGSALYTCEVEIATDAEAAAVFSLTCSSPGAGDPDGNRVGADCTNGAITVASETQATIVIGDAVGAPGDFVPLTVSLQTAVAVARTENVIEYVLDVAIAADTNGQPMCAVNPAINKPDTTFAFIPAGCSPGSTCQAVVAMVRSNSNTEAIPNGAALYTCQIAIAEDAGNATYGFLCSNAAATAPDGTPVATSCVNGEVVVGVQPTATATSATTATATTSAVNTPTATPTGVSATATITNTPGTPTPPTATSTATRTATSTRRPSNEDDGCQVVGTGAQSGTAWMLILPAALLVKLRRRRR